MRTLALIIEEEVSSKGRSVAAKVVGAAEAVLGASWVQDHGLKVQGSMPVVDSFGVARRPKPAGEEKPLLIPDGALIARWLDGKVQGLTINAADHTLQEAEVQDPGEREEIARILVRDKYWPSVEQADLAIRILEKMRRESQIFRTSESFSRVAAFPRKAGAGAVVEVPRSAENPFLGVTLQSIKEEHPALYEVAVRALRGGELELNEMPESADQLGLLLRMAEIYESPYLANLALLGLLSRIQKDEDLTDLIDFLRGISIGLVRQVAEDLAANQRAKALGQAISSFAGIKKDFALAWAQSDPAFLSAILSQPSKRLWAYRCTPDEMRVDFKRQAENPDGLYLMKKYLAVPGLIDAGMRQSAFADAAKNPNGLEIMRWLGKEIGRMDGSTVENAFARAAENPNGLEIMRWLHEQFITRPENLSTVIVSGFKSVQFAFEDAAKNPNGLEIMRWLKAECGKALDDVAVHKAFQNADQNPNGAEIKEWLQREFAEWLSRSARRWKS